MSKNIIAVKFKGETNFFSFKNEKDAKNFSEEVKTNFKGAKILYGKR